MRLMRSPENFVRNRECCPKSSKIFKILFLLFGNKFSWTSLSRHNYNDTCCSVFSPRPLQTNSGLQTCVRFTGNSVPELSLLSYGGWWLHPSPLLTRAKVLSLNLSLKFHKDPRYLENNISIYQSLILSLFSIFSQIGTSKAFKDGWLQNDYGSY